MIGSKLEFPPRIFPTSAIPAKLFGPAAGSDIRYPGFLADVGEVDGCLNAGACSATLGK